MKKVLKGLIMAISVGIFFITFMALIVILNISYFFKVENVTKGVMQMDVAKALDEMEKSNNGGSMVTEVLDNAYIVAEYYGVSSSVIDEMVNDEIVKEFFGVIAGNMTDYVINGTENTILTSEDFNKILDENIDKWIKKSKVPINETQKEQFLKTVKSQSGQIIDNLPTAKVLSDKLEITNLSQVQQIFSKQSKVIIMSLFVISLILILILKRKEFKNIMYLGYTTLIVGIITIGIGLFSSDLITMLLTKSEIFLDVSMFSDMLTRQLIITGFVCTALALFLYLTYLILRKLRKA